MKKMCIIIMTVIMLFLLSITAFAAESTTTNSLQNYFKNDPRDLKISMSEAVNDTGISTRGWPGEGPAKQVTSVSIEQVGILNVDGHEGNIGVLVKVIGYGRDYAKYDSPPVNYFSSEGFILYGTLVDGWYYLYDCGAPTLGDHRFDIEMVSLNPPYTEKSAWATFTIK